MLKFLNKISSRIDSMGIIKENIFIIYDEESELSSLIGNSVINYFENIKVLKIPNERIGKLPNNEEINFVNNISGICFLFFSDKGIDFKKYLNGRKLRDFLIGKDIATFEVGRLKYFNTIKLQSDLLFSLEESISEEVELKGIKLEEKFNKATNISVNNECFYKGPFEEMKYNFGLYKGQRNTLKGSLYPVGEVLSELKNLNNINGKLKIYAFPNIINKMIYLDIPKYVYIEKGYLIGHELGTEFDLVLDKIRELESENEGIIVREMGFSINKNIKKEFMFPEISSAEKTYGYHISLGGKYGVYNNLNKQKNQNIHVDIMVEIQSIKFDEELVFSEGEYFFDK